MVRPVDDDYGVDREVEIFSEGRTTGLTFKVQLKAGDSAPTPGPSHRATTDQVGCWKSLDVPVLIVSWVVETESLYGRWAHTLGREPGRRLGARTMTVSYGPEDLLVDPAERVLQDVVLVRDLRAGRLPRPLALRLRVDDSFTAASQPELIVHLRSLVRSRALGSVLEVLPAGHDDHRPEFLVHLSGGRSNVLRESVPIDVASVRVTMPTGACSEHQGQAALDVLASDALVAMAVALERTGARAPAARLLDGVAQKSRIALVPEVAQVIGELVDDQELVDEAIGLALRLMDDEDPSVRDMSDMSLRVVLQHLERVDGSSCLSLVEQMRRRADHERLSNNPRRAGRVHYDLAKVLGGLGERSALLPELAAALTLDLGCRDRDYSFRERGGVRWDVGDQLGAAEDYRQALWLGADPAELQPLLIDALMWAGRCSEASEVLAGWVPSGHPLARLALLDGVVVQEVVRMTGLAQQDRRPADLPRIEEVGEAVEPCVELLRSTDALDARFWLNLALGQTPPSLPRWILIAQVRQHDVLPWAMAMAIATAVAFMAEDSGEDLLPHVVGSAVDLTEVDAFLAAVDEVADQALDAPAASRLRAAVHGRIASSPDQPTRVAARVITG